MTVLYAGLGWILLFGVVGLAWWIFSSKSRRDKVVAGAKSLMTKKKDEGHHAPAAKPAHDPHHKGGSHDDHHKEPLRKVLLGWCVTIAAIGALLWAGSLLFKHWGFGQIPGASREYRASLAVTHGNTAAPVRVIPSDAVSCPEGKIVIRPERSIRVSIPIDMLIDFQPNSEEGTVTACDYHKPDSCSSTTSVTEAGTSVLVVKNITQEPVDFTCHYIPR